MSTKNPRTFVLGDKLMTGEDVKQWQDDVKKLFKDVGIKCPIVVDGIYAQATRSFSAALCEAYGLISKTAMAEGVTPELRTKLRHNDLNKAEKSRFESKARKNYRAKLRDRWHTFSDLVHPPVAKIITDSWGFHPGVHDGEDVIAIEGTAAFAMVRARSSTSALTAGGTSVRRATRSCASGATASSRWRSSRTTGRSRRACTSATGTVSIRSSGSVRSSSPDRSWPRSALPTLPIFTSW
jgi:hypothetical protein